MRTAVVVGAGVGGLAVAGALSRSDWQVTLLERDTRLRGGGAALLIWPNGVAALRALGLGRGLDAIAFPTTASGIRRPDGRWLVEAQAATGPADQPVVVHTDDLHDTLMAGLGDRLEIRTGTEVTGIRTAPADRPAITTGRYTFEADLVVAADGADSLLRRRAVPGASLVPAGFTTWRAVIPWFRAPKLPDTVPPAGEMLGTGRRFLHATLGERGSAGGSSRGGIYWAATAPGAARPESSATQLSLLRRWFADWQSPVRELLAATEPEDLVQRSGQVLRPLPPRFDKAVGGGGIALLGDAAHVATSNLTQGACLAFEDAATLQALVAGARPGPELVAALEAFTRVRRPRVARVARSSHRLGRVMQAQGRLTIRARDAALGALAPRLLGRARDTAADWQPPS
ncbi:FAD-dependent oxidoreductase [Luedemannella helvata]|uniref:FAD-dependent monooxygenase n=1 Tax=Luedemannella helvata TaxID=349315 RepID=A0ABP4WNJ6_9ACTN